MNTTQCANKGWKTGISAALAAFMVSGALLTGAVAARADDHHDHDHHWDRDHHAVVRHEAYDLKQDEEHRQNTKNTWRNVALASGAVAALGLLKHDNTITFVGAAGALYSAERYEQDRKSQSQEAAARAALFDRGSFDRNGVHYTRHETMRNGKKYYYFSR